MTDTTTTPAPTPTPTSTATQRRHMQDFLISRELAEVYLLLDNVSSVRIKQLPEISTDDKLFNPNVSWIKQICDIAWPPDPATVINESLMAAQLLKAKDMLNIAAAPATGASIAFTTLMTGDSADARHQSWWHRLFGRKRHSDVPENDQTERDGKDAKASADPPVWPPTRGSLAELAYPNFARSAHLYRWGRWSLIGFLVLWLIATCFFSWDIATGSALLNRVGELNQQAIVQGDVTSNKPKANPSATPSATPTTASATPTSAPTVAPSAAPTANDAARSANDKKAGPSAGGGAATEADRATDATLPDVPACQSAEIKKAQRCRLAWGNLQHWLKASTLPRRVFAALLGGAPTPRPAATSTPTPTPTAIPTAAARTPTPAVVASGTPAPTPSGATPSIAPPSPSPSSTPDAASACGCIPSDTTAPDDDLLNLEWAAVFIGVLAGTILPIAYGVLGAAAAVVRGISIKMRDYTLMPRDMILAWVQLALGAVIGACIGLFVNSDAGTATQGGLIGSVHLTQSALCFVAGFGVEGVFQALEALVRRVFNLEQDRPTPTPSRGAT